jgi:mRNA interferase MazF
VTIKDWAPERRDIIWINRGPQVGREMKKEHPLLVLSPRDFNARTGLVIGLPMTTAEYNRTNPFAVSFKGPKNVESFILTHQPKSFDWRRRRAKPHPWKRAPEDVYASACESLEQIINLTN